MSEETEVAAVETPETEVEAAVVDPLEEHDNYIDGEIRDEEDIPSTPGAPGEADAAGEGAPAAEDLAGGEPPEEIDPYLLDRARSFGMTIEEAEGLGAAGLSQTLRVMERQQTHETETKPPTPTPEETARAEEDALYAKKYDLQFPETDENGERIEYNVHARKALEGMNEHYFNANQRHQAALKDVLDRQEEMEARADRQYALKMQAEFDTEIAALGPDYEHLFGKGTESEIGENSAGYRNRGKLLREMGVIKGVRDANGLPPQSMSDTISQALSSVFKEKETTKAVRKVKGKVEKASRGLSVPPTDRKTATTPLVGEEAANAAVAAEIIKRGGDPGPQEQESFFGD